MTFKSVLAVIAISTGLAAPASALTVTAIDGVWENSTVDGTSPVSGEGTSEILWGNSIGEGRSGYEFEATPTRFEIEADTQFVLGTFTHHNFPVTGSALTSVDLELSFSIDGLDSSFTSVFSFTHDETDNHWNMFRRPLSSATCADGGANGSGRNVHGCADLVTAINNEAHSDTFEIDGVTYVLEITGFQYHDELLSNFWTIERMSNSAQLLAVFRTVDIQEPPVSEVPLPASGLLLAGGLAGLFARRRFR